MNEWEPESLGWHLWRLRQALIDLWWVIVEELHIPQMVRWLDDTVERIVERLRHERT